MLVEERQQRVRLVPLGGGAAVEDVFAEERVATSQACQAAKPPHQM
jgi:hypothetical protein